MLVLLAMSNMLCIALLTLEEGKNEQCLIQWPDNQGFVFK